MLLWLIKQGTRFGKIVRYFMLLCRETTPPTPAESEKQAVSLLFRGSFLSF